MCRSLVKYAYEEKRLEKNTFLHLCNAQIDAHKFCMVPPSSITVNKWIFTHLRDHVTSFQAMLTASIAVGHCTPFKCTCKVQ